MERKEKLRFAAYFLAIILILVVITLVITAFSFILEVATSHDNYEDKKYSFDAKFTSVNIDGVNGNLTIGYHDKNTVVIECEDVHSSFSANIMGGVLNVTMDKIPIGTNDLIVKISLPKNLYLENFSVVGYGDYKISDLRANNSTIVFEAGDLYCNNFISKESAEITMTAGTAIFDSSYMNDVNFDLQAGSIEVDGMLMGNCFFDVDLAKATFNLSNPFDSVKIFSDTSIGFTKINGKSIDFDYESNPVKFSSTYKIENNFGSMNLNFEK